MKYVVHLYSLFGVCISCPVANEYEPTFLESYSFVKKGMFSDSHSFGDFQTQERAWKAILDGYKEYKYIPRLFISKEVE